MLNQPIQVGALTLSNRALLAPLAGVSDVPFRRICQEMGAGLTFVEMLSAAAIIHSSPRTFEMMARHADEALLGVQVTGPSADMIAAAVRILDATGFDLIDINMGCPVRKIVSSGWGCALLKDGPVLSEIVSRAREATSKPFTVKCRLGFHRDALGIEEIAERIVAAGADMLTIHGRFRDDDYSVPVDYGGIASGMKKRQGRVVGIGNGDVMDAESAMRMVSETGCDGVMVSRGALGNPWIFREILAASPVAPTMEEWLAAVRRHIDYHEAFYGDNELSARRIRKHLIWYAHGFPRCNRLRRQCGQVDSLKSARELIARYAADVPSQLRRFEDEDAVQYEPRTQMDRAADRGVGDDGLERPVLSAPH